MIAVVELREITATDTGSPMTASVGQSPVAGKPAGGVWTAPHLLDAAVDAPEFVVLESCHSTWMFDPDNKRFCRVLKGSLGSSSVATQWRPYDRLVLHPDSDAFVVFLDASGTRLLRSWRHTAHCDQCGGEVTAELSLADLRRVTRA
jgi:hypothetical protein